jgi:hypothetical protein
MPKIFKSGKELKGNKNSGDKPDSVKIKKALKEIINAGLANTLANEDLLNLQDIPVKKRPHIKIKDIVMPIVLKNMVDRRDITSGDNPIAILSNVIPSDNSDKKDNTDEETDKSCSGGDIGEQDSIDTPLPDSSGSV